jgi:hypothetical protein
MAFRQGTPMPAAFELPTKVDTQLRVALVALSDSQCAIVRRDQLTMLGLSRNVIDSMLAAGRWRTRGVIVVAMHNGPLTHEQRLWAAVLNAGPSAALAARTAATDQGLIGWEPECIEIVVPRSTTVPAGLRLNVKVHESRRFSTVDIHPGRSLPTVRIERALIDAAVWSRSPRTACGVLAAGVQQRLTQVPRLREVLESAGAVRHRRLLAAVLNDIEGGAQAMSEVAFLRFCRRNGLPRPVLQVVRLDRSGKRRYIDATFRRCDGRLLRVEIDGALHLVVRTYWNDMARGNELVIVDEPALRFPSYVVHANEWLAADQLRRALGVSGSQRPIAS